MNVYDRDYTSTVQFDQEVDGKPETYVYTADEAEELASHLAYALKAYAIVSGIWPGHVTRDSDPGFPGLTFGGTSLERSKLREFVDAWELVAQTKL